MGKEYKITLEQVADELKDIKGYLGGIVRGDTLEAKHWYLIGLRDAACYTLESIIDGIDSTIESDAKDDKENHPLPDKYNKIGGGCGDYTL